MTPRELTAWLERWYLSVPQLADLLEVHPQTVRNWTHGRTPIPRMAVLSLETIAGEREKLRGTLARQRSAMNRQRAEKRDRQAKLRDKRIAAAL